MGLGGLLILVFLIVAVGFLFRGFFGGLLCGKLADRFGASYERAKADGKLSPSEEDVFYDLLVSIQRPETSVSACSYACILLERCLVSPGGDLREEAVTAATDIRELLDADPSSGFREVMGVMQKYPEMSAANWYAKTKQQPALAPQP